jgi:hypothetical protein
MPKTYLGLAIGGGNLRVEPGGVYEVSRLFDAEWEAVQVTVTTPPVSPPAEVPPTATSELVAPPQPSEAPSATIPPQPTDQG